MSAPHVCGAIALLISGLMKNEIPYSPYSIKRALWNSATKLQHVDRFAQGNGLLNVEAAYDNLVKYYNRSERDIRYATEWKQRYIICMTFLNYCWPFSDLLSPLERTPRKEFTCDVAHWTNPKNLMWRFNPFSKWKENTVWFPKWSHFLLLTNERFWDFRH